MYLRADSPVGNPNEILTESIYRGNNRRLILTKRKVRAIIKNYILCLMAVALGSTVYGESNLAVLRGTVRDATDGKPLEAAIVSLTRDDKSTATGRNGEFEFTAEPGWWSTRLQVQATGYRTYTGDKIRIREGDTLSFDIQLRKKVDPLVVSCDTCPPPGVIVGRVVDRTTDQPLSGATVSISAIDKAQKTSEDGVFSFTDISAGEHVLLVKHSEYHPVKETIRVRDGSVTNPTVGLKPLLTTEDTTGTVMGRITDSDSGTGVKNAEVSLLNTTYATIADSAGEYRLPLIPPGTYSLLATKWGYDAQVADDVTVRAKEETRKSLVLEPRATGTAALRGTVGALSGTVLDGQGDPVGSVGLLLSETGDFTRSNVMGQFRFDSIPGGVYSVLAVDERYDTLRSQEVDVWNGEETRIEMRLKNPGNAGVGDGVVLSEGRGAIVGLVVDANKGTGLAGAQIRLEDAREKAVSGLNGRYALVDLRPGTYEVIGNHNSYKEKLIEGITVRPGERTELDILLSASDVTELQRMTITAPPVANTGAALLKKRQQSMTLSNAISSEEISKAGASTAADAMKQVTGASVVGGKYIYIRGLGDRYTITMLNGAVLPGLNPDENAFPVDLFPSKFLDNIIIYKTMSPDRPVNFGGGIVDLQLRTFPEKFNFRFGASVGMNTEATFRDDYLTYEGGALDWLGIDDGTRAMPDKIDEQGIDTITAVKARKDKFTAHRLDSLTNAFNHDFILDTTTAPPDHGFSLSLGDKREIFTRPLGYLLSMTYSRSYTRYDPAYVASYTGVRDSNGMTHPNLSDTLGDSQSKTEVLWGGLGQVSVEPFDKNLIEYTLLYNRNSEDMARYMSGWFTNLMDKNRVVESQIKHYVERDLQWHLWSGEHTFESLGDLGFSWHVNRAVTRQNEPDHRLFTYEYSVDTISGEKYGWFIDISGNYNMPERYYRKLNEHSLQYQGTLKKPLYSWAEKPMKFEIGYSNFVKNREVEMHNFIFREQDTSFADFEGNIEEYFNEDNAGTIRVDTISNGSLKYRTGRYVQQRGMDKSNYDGIIRIIAGYGLTTIPITEELEIRGGVRVEKTTMRVSTRDEESEVGELDELNWLAAGDAKYTIVDGLDFRLSYGKTLTRPTMREKAPFSSQTYPRGPIYNGNPHLKQNVIDNYEIRLEWFRTPGEVVSLGGFYKDLTNPIQLMILNENKDEKHDNVDKGKVYGAELEIRSGLDWLHPGLAGFMVGGNVTWEKAMVDLNEEEIERAGADLNVDVKEQRPFQGASPYLLNVFISYDNEELGLSVSSFFNMFGKRLSGISYDPKVPDIYEYPEKELNVTTEYKLGKSGLKVKLSGKNLLNSASQFAYDGFAKNAKYRKSGRKFSVGVSWGID